MWTLKKQSGKRHELWILVMAGPMCWMVVCGHCRICLTGGVGIWYISSATRYSLRQYRGPGWAEKTGQPILQPSIIPSMCLLQSIKAWNPYSSTAPLRDKFRGWKIRSTHVLTERPAATAHQKPGHLFNVVWVRQALLSPFRYSGGGKNGLCHDDSLSYSELYNPYLYMYHVYKIPQICL